MLALLCFLAVPGFPQQEDAAGEWQKHIDAGIALADDADYEEAIAEFRIALKAAESFDPSDIRLFEARARLADACGDDLSCEEEEINTVIQAALESRHLVRAHLDDASLDRYVDLLGRLAYGIRAYGESQSAVNYHREAVELLAERRGEKHESVADACYRLAWAYISMEDREKAREAMNRGLRVFEDNPDIGIEAHASFIERSADLYAEDTDTVGDALSELDRSLVLRENAWGDQDIRYLDALSRAASSAGIMQRGEYALSLFQKSAELRLRAHGERDPRYWETLTRLAEYHKGSSQYDTAEETYLTLYRLLLRYPDAEDRKDHLAGMLTSLAELLQEQEKYAAAAERGEEALRVLNEGSATAAQTYGRQPYEREMRLHELLARIYVQAGRYGDSDRHFDAYAAALRKDFPWAVGNLALSLGDLYVGKKEYYRAAPKLEEAIAVQEQTGYASNIERGETMQKLAEVYTALGRHEDANRMSMASLALLMSEMTEALPEASRAKAVGIALAVAAGVFAATVALSGFGFFFFRRRLLRKTDALYLAAPPPVLAGAVLSASEDVPPPLDPPVLPSAVEEAPGGDPLGDAHLPEEPPGTEIPETVFPSGEEAMPEPPNVLAPEPAVLMEITDAPAATEPLFQTPPPPPPLPPPAPPAVRSIAFHGDGTTLFALRVRNLLLSLLTLGAYSFWGKARVRSYLLGQIDVDEDRLAFHGTGKELLFGWLRAAPFLGLILFLPNVLPLFWERPEALVVGQFAVFAAVLLLIPIARAGAYRYRLNRMSWRGVRFSFRGSTFRFLLLYLRGYVLLPLTCGLYAPFFHVRAERVLLNGSSFGDRGFRFHGRGRDLLPCFVCAVPLGVFTLGLFWPWYRALRARYCWAQTTFGEARFRSTVTGFGLLKLWSGNLAILIFTLGLGASWSLTRTLRYWSAHTALAGDPALETVRQDPLSSTAAGESFADFLGFEFGV